MESITLIGVDIAKRVFHFCAVSRSGRVISRKRCYRSDVLRRILEFPRCVIAMEACGGSNYWAREFEKLGHEVKLIAPQFVKPFVKSNKNDHADAEAICEAALRPTMRFVSAKSVEQQDVQALHRVRERQVKARTALANEVRGLLMEYGVTIPRGITHVRRHLIETLDKHSEKLTPIISGLLRELYDEFSQVDSRVSELEKRITAMANKHPVCKRLLKIEGVGPLTASAVVSHVGDPQGFRRGRELSAYFGLVPRQHSTGGKPRLLGISKRGDRYIRKLLVHGARAVLGKVGNKTDSRSLWIKSLIERRGYNKACVALANKNARIIWALMAHDEEYRIAA